MALCIGQKAGKKDTTEFGKPICNPWGANFWAFIINFGAKQQAKMLKVGPSFFSWDFKCKVCMISVF